MPATASARSSLGRQLAAEPQSGPHVVPADPRIQSDPGDHVVDVRAVLLGQSRQLVREGQLEREERIGPVLDQLGRRDIHDEHRRRERLEQGGDEVDRRRIRVGKVSDHDPCRTQEVRHRRPLAEEFRVRQDPARREPGPVSDELGRAGWQGAANDERSATCHDRREAVQGRFELAEVAAPVGPDGRAHAHHDDVGLEAGPVCDGQAAAVQGRRQGLGKTGLVHRRSPLAQRGEPGRAGLDDLDSMPEAGEPDRGDQADIAPSDDDDPARFLRHAPEPISPAPGPPAVRPSVDGRAGSRALGRGFQRDGRFSALAASPGSSWR